MPAYWIAHVLVTDEDAYVRYAKLAGPALAAFGGRFLARGGAYVQLEGRDRARNVVVEFPDLAAAEACYRSAGLPGGARPRARRVRAGSGDRRGRRAGLTGAQDKDQTGDMDMASGTGPLGRARARARSRANGSRRRSTPATAASSSRSPAARRARPRRSRRLTARAPMRPTRRCSPTRRSTRSTSRCRTATTSNGRRSASRPASTCCARSRWR